MTEQPTSTFPASESVDIDLGGGFFDDWIAGASTARRAVVIYGKPGLYAEYQQIDRELTIAKAEAAEGGGDEMGGSPVRRLERRLQALYEEWEASRTTWVVEMIDDDLIDAIKAQLAEQEVLEPKQPEEPERPAAPQPLKDLPGNATEAQKRSHTVKKQAYDAARVEHEAAVAAWQVDYEAYTTGPLADYEKAAEAYADNLNLHLISAALREVKDAEGNVRQRALLENGRVTLPAVTVDQLRNLRKTLGRAQLLRLMAGITEATYSETELTAPFSQSTSEDAPTS